MVKIPIINLFQTLYNIKHERCDMRRFKFVYMLFFDFY